jgi:two-component system phosphate regulon sensor histidine kinase PhoR
VKLRLNIIFTLLVAAVILLGGFQVYSFTEQYKLHQEEVGEKVTGILKKLKEQIEIRNRCFEVYSKTFIKTGDCYFMAVSSNTGNKREIDTVPMYYMGDSLRNNTKLFQYGSFSFPCPVTAEVNVRFKYEVEDTVAFYNYRQKVMHTMDLAIVKNIISGEAPFFQQYDTSYIDSTLRTEFSQSGLGSDFVFALRLQENDSVLYISQRQFIPHANTNGIKYGMTNRLTLIRPFYISIYFPHKNSVVLAESWFPLTSSTIILLGLTIGFWYFLRVIRKQKKLSEMKNDFINNMTHEFNTPISNIALGVETILSKSKQNLEERDRKILEIIANENFHLRENVSRILQVASIEKGTMPLHTTNINICLVIKHVVNTFDVIAKKSEAKININYDEGSSILNGDETHLVNVFYNLIDNALKYCDKKPLIDITLKQLGDKIFVSISDNGIGIPQEQLEHIFDRFYRVSYGYKHDVKGFGLGLSYVKNIILLHKGSISVKSKLGQGTIFEISFPAVRG